MRNTVLRHYHEMVLQETNKALESGVEPYAMALALRMMANQLDSLAREYEQKETAQEQKVGEDYESELEGTSEE